MLKIFVLFIFLATITFCTFSQPRNEGHYFSGYKSSVSTGNFNYHSPRPDVNTSLLVRSVDSNSFIVWETETLPAKTADSFISFVWMFGIDANSEKHNWKLYLNDRFCLSFSNPQVSSMNSWTVSGIENSSLEFRPVMLDKYNDPMGYAVLRVPWKLLLENKSQKIKITGESAGSNVWYMTFESAVSEKMEVVQQEAIIRENGKQYYSVLFNITHLADQQAGWIQVESFPKKTFTLQSGFNSIQYLLPVSDTQQNFTYKISEGLVKGFSSGKFIIHPVKHWYIYLVQHTHTDIGYTRPQSEILPDHLRYIDFALDFCDQTDTFPDPAKFRWTCETSWAIREYLLSRPAFQVERLKKRIREGRIEVTALFLNGSDLSDEASQADYLKPVGLFRDSGISVKSAMQSDINGVPWCLADYLPVAGIKYLNMAQNNHRARKPFEIPTTFWWISPSGNKLLVNRPEHYMWGNSLGILSGLSTFGTSLFLHLGNLEQQNYPFDHYAIEFSGYMIDNSPPSTKVCELVREWNEKYEWPKLQLATISEFFDYMEKNHSHEMPVLTGAWPDWWMDGFGSAAIETAIARTTHCELIANKGLLSIAEMMQCNINSSIQDNLKEIVDALAFYDEHTFGSAECISDPLGENSYIQWNMKAAFAWEAFKKNRILTEKAIGLIQNKIPISKLPGVTVFNTMNWKRGGLATVFIDHQILPVGKIFTVLDEKGNTIPAQLISSLEEGSYWGLLVNDIPPMGYRAFLLKVSDQNKPPSFLKKSNGILENGFYRIIVDTVTGKINSLYDKQLKNEFADVKAQYGIGEFIYEKLGKNRHQLELLKLDNFSREGLKDIKIEGIKEGEIWTSLFISGKLAACSGENAISCEIRLFKMIKKIEFCFSMKKIAVSDPEAVYIAFPFSLKESQLVWESSGGNVIAGKNQLEGSASDWDGIQNFVSVRNSSAQLVFISPRNTAGSVGRHKPGQI